MKIKLYIITLVCILFIIIFATSFKTAPIKPFYNITESISTIENQYAQLPPDTGKKKKEESQYDNNYKKIEDTTAYKAFHEKIDTAINNSYSKTKIISSEVAFGVIKDGNCGGYPELDVFMDCEDHNNETKYFGWIGSNYVDDKGNVLLKFCVVDGSANFHKTNVDYAILALGGYPNSCSGVYYKTFTNEVGDDVSDYNSNSTTFISGSIATDIFSINSNGNYGFCSFSDNSHPLIFDNYGYCSEKHIYITTLAFFYFQREQNSNMEGEPDFPNLTTLGGFNYGVFGRFGNHQGYIYTDDEDIDKDKENYENGNCNNMYKGNFNNYWGNSGFSNIMENVGNVNSRIFFSKVKNCHY